MDLITRWNNAINTEFSQDLPHLESSVGEMILNFLNYYRMVWWNCSSAQPAFEYSHSREEQSVHEKNLDRMVNGLISELKNIPSTSAERSIWQERFRPEISQFVLENFNLKPQHLQFIESKGFIDAIQQFTRMARDFDPHITIEDIYQAGRNVVTANLIQLLLGLPVKITPSIFAYSMLYPYTDNYLDDPEVSTNTKMAFNQRFRRRLMGEIVEPANSHEAAINTLISMIESEWDRTENPQVYESLLTIHRAQTRSLDLVAPGISPFERDILGISFEKGGTSVMTDGYLAAGTLTTNQARVLFGFGAFTQLMDDLEDFRTDMLEKRASIFSLTAPFWKLDSLTNRFIHFGHTVISDLSAFETKDIAILAELMSACVDPMLLNTIGQSAEFFSKDYITQVETYMPFQFKSLDKQRKKFTNHKMDGARLMEIFIM